MKLKKLLIVFILGLYHSMLYAQPGVIPSKNDTLKGSITKDRSWWNLKHYAIAIRPDFRTKSIVGQNEIKFSVVRDYKNDFMQVDLQAPLVIDSALYENRKVPVTKYGDAWFLKIPALKMKSLATVVVHYSGIPKESFNPPWDGGISWSADSLGRPWITMGVQTVGASVWLPCKEHQSDEPDDGASISITVPDTLTAVANGRLMGITDHNNGSATYAWTVRNPINNYGIAFYIGKYVQDRERYKGEKGLLYTDYWVIDYHKSKVHSYLKKEVDKTLEVFEYWFGPYPFYKDNFKMVEAPYPGMEHQSAIAYGNDFKYGRVKLKNLSYWDLKTDRLIVHEMAHEWFGNSITTNDVTDQWIHEGFAGYAEELFIEYKYGKKAANEFFEARTVGKTKNIEPLIRRYGIFESGGSYVYLRGWKLIHMLRTIVDDDAKFRQILRTTTQNFYHKTINSSELEAFFSKISGRDLQPVFNQYLRNVDIPTFEYQITGNLLRYRYANCVPDFNMPIRTDLTGMTWLVPGATWKEFKLTDSSKTSVVIASDFYVNIKEMK